ncbi:MAG: alanine racemase [Cellvibrionaceae bacterium]|nr:alanine racemase [Cellvibrionaceae bacterium]
MHQYSGVLKINLSALRRNWRVMRSRFRGQYCGAVVKANAYGLGVAPVVQTLYSEGCRHFFVATLDEAMQVRRLVPEPADIFVLQGVYPGAEQRFCDERLVPVIYNADMLRRWLSASSAGPRRCALKINTGMNRLGLNLQELGDFFQAHEDWPADVRIELVMSHLACADEPDHQLNSSQLALFRRVADVVRQRFPHTIFSLANSAGIFLGEDWHFDLARPGIALYGGCCAPALQGLLSVVVTLHLPVMQLRHVAAGESIGYGADFVAPQDLRVLVVSGGYADGILRSVSPRMAAWRGERLPLVGRISMDSCVFDATHLALDDVPGEGDFIEVIGEHQSLDGLADAAGTISYELLTRLGDRLSKVYFEELEHIAQSSSGISQH